MEKIRWVGGWGRVGWGGGLVNGFWVGCCTVDRGLEGDLSWLLVGRRILR